MNPITVNSSALNTIAFDDVSKNVFITFNSNPEKSYEYATKDYENVKAKFLDVIRELENNTNPDDETTGPSIGKLFWKAKKDGDLIEILE